MPRLCKSIHQKDKNRKCNFCIYKKNLQGHPFTMGERDIPFFTKPSKPNIHCLLSKFYWMSRWSGQVIVDIFWVSWLLSLLKSANFLHSRSQLISKSYLNIKGIDAAFPILITRFFNHLKWTSSKCRIFLGF